MRGLQNGRKVYCFNVVMLQTDEELEEARGLLISQNVVAHEVN